MPGVLVIERVVDMDKYVVQRMVGEGSFGKV